MGGELFARLVIFRICLSGIIMAHRENCQSRYSQMIIIEQIFFDTARSFTPACRAEQEGVAPRIVLAAKPDLLVFYENMPA
ncbi:hypothetical protein [Methanoregula sp.]|uniref:hypothetical protein n=1 Tax=Methanoregula sp. TaxID=2052170 RepID=UPI0025E5815C|nr:hypothetical protein [Methanoregula sp.]